MILSLFDYSGEWSKPYVEAGYTVYRVDIAHSKGISFEPGVSLFGEDLSTRGGVRRLLYAVGDHVVHGVLACPPCDCWTRASAWLWRSGTRTERPRDPCGSSTTRWRSSSC